MDLALLLLALVWGLSGRSGSAPAARPRPQLPPNSERPEQGGGGGEGQVSTPPWPQSGPPGGLPPFPGPGWVYDEPPPRAVVQRAGQLVSQLWAQGKGAFKVEQTAGRWIVYQAAIVASGKKGVVAFREKTAARLPAAPPPSGTRTSSSPAPTAQRAVKLLRRGMGIKPLPPDPDVRVAQGLLRIKADGQFGAGTETAVRAFQRSRGLNEDGVIGAATWKALFAARAIQQAQV